MPPAFDPAELERARRSLARRDPAMRPLIREVGPCRMALRGDPYRALVRSILHQQLAGAAAAAIERRVKSAYRGRYPKAGVLARASDTELRAAGLSRQKMASIRAVASAFEAGTLSSRRLRRMPDDEVVAAVTQIKGIGEWTAHMLLMFSLGRLDVLPVGDYGVRKGAQQLYGLAELPKPRELASLGERWRPYRSVASWYLWRQTELPAVE